MVDPVSRPDRYADRAPDLDSVNGLIQARIDGVISRRQLMRRAASPGSQRPGGTRAQLRFGQPGSASQRLSHAETEG